MNSSGYSEVVANKQEAVDPRISVAFSLEIHKSLTRTDYPMEPEPRVNCLIPKCNKQRAEENVEDRSDWLTFAISNISGPISALHSVHICVPTTGYESFFASVYQTLVFSTFEEFKPHNIITEADFVLVCRYLLKGRIDSVSGYCAPDSIELFWQVPLPAAIAAVINAVGVVSVGSGGFRCIPRSEPTPVDKEKYLYNMVTESMSCSFTHLINMAISRGHVRHATLSRECEGTAYWLLATRSISTYIGSSEHDGSPTSPSPPKTKKSKIDLNERNMSLKKRRIALRKYKIALLKKYKEALKKRKISLKYQIPEQQPSLTRGSLELRNFDRNIVICSAFGDFTLYDQLLAAVVQRKFDGWIAHRPPNVWTTKLWMHDGALKLQYIDGA